jgi:hypothetical protein
VPASAKAELLALGFRQESKWSGRTDDKFVTATFYDDSCKTRITSRVVKATIARQLIAGQRILSIESGNVALRTHDTCRMW